jgi:hypothetical protein
MRGVVMLVAVLGGGCNQVFGIEETYPSEPDTDGYLVPDRIDNCPDHDNTDQLDGDDDGRGDACDG